MKRIILSLTLILNALGILARTADQHIADAMNHNDWFALDSIYSSTPKDSINLFLEFFTRCLPGNRLNRPDISIPAFQELFNNQYGNLGLDNLISSQKCVSILSILSLQQKLPGNK